ACSPLRNQVPGVAIVGGSWFSLTLLGFHHVNLTAVVNEDIDREDVEHVSIVQVNKSKVKVSCFIRTTKHVTTVGFCATIINNIVVFLLVIPGRLHLYPNKHSLYIKDKIVGETVSNRLKNAPLLS